MYQLVYISIATRALNQADIDSLEKQAAKNNKAHHITSMLLFSGASFLQLLEGRQSNIEKIYKTITKDPRNTQNIVLFERKIKRRFFPKIAMECRTVEQTTFETIYSLCLSNPDDAIKKMDLMTNVRLSEYSKFDPERFVLFRSMQTLELEFTHGFFEFATELAADEVFLLKDDSKLIYVNQAACEKLGYSKGELVGMYVWEWDPLFPKHVWPGFIKDFLEKRHLHFQTQHRKKNGEVFPVEIHAHLYEENGENYLLAFVKDISEQYKVQRELLEHKKHLEKVIELRTKELNKTIAELAIHKKILDLHSGVSITDANGTITYVNDLFCTLCGYSRKELIGVNHSILNSGRHPDGFFQKMFKTLLQGQLWEGDICNKTKSGELFWLNTTIIPKLDAYGKPIQYFSVGTDITERLTAQEKIEYLANTDQLTGLANRHQFFTNFNQLSQETHKKNLALAYVDVDKFKHINDKYGHLIGDKVLQCIATTLKTHCLKTDLPARIGGDEFAVLLVGYSVEKIKRYVRHTLKATEGLSCHRKKIPLSISIGLTLFDGASIDIQKIMQKADIAMYEAKRKGGNTYIINRF